MNYKYKRKRLIIKSSLQYKILFGIMFMLAFVGLIAGLLILMMSRNMIYMLSFSAPEYISYAKELIADSFVILCGIVPLWIIIMGIVSIYFSNKIAGPIYRIEQDLKKMIRHKEINEIRIRKNDEFQELAAILNNFLKQVKFKQDEETE